MSSIKVPHSGPGAPLAALVASLGAVLGVTSVTVKAADPVPAGVPASQVDATARQWKEAPTAVQVDATARQDKGRPVAAPGQTFTPSPNDGVVVAFPNGQPRAPVVQGALYNGSQPPPVTNGPRPPSAMPVPARPVGTRNLPAAGAQAAPPPASAAKPPHPAPADQSSTVPPKP
jgi:Type VI secretion system/phage-baseplate injector OB domain